MKSVLSRCLSQLSIGLVVDVRRISICVMRASPFGRRILTHEVHDRGDEPAVDIVKRLLEPWIPPRRGKQARPGPWVQIGIPEAQSFLSVVPITQANRSGSAQAFFLEAVQATNIRAEDRVIDLLRIEVDKKPLACVAAASADAVNGMIEMVTGLGARVGLIQQNPTALYRAGASHAKSPRGSKLCVRFFLGTHHAIGVLGAGDHALFWHAFKLEPGREEAVLLASYATLWMLWRNTRIPIPIDTIFIHGRPELPLAADPEAFRQRTGARAIRSAGPSYGIISAAHGLALMDPLSDEPRHDLSRGLKPAPMISDIFPWAELAFHGALIGGVSLVILGTASEAEVRLRSIQAEMAAFPWAKSLDQRKLDDEKKQLDEKLKAVATFKGGRVRWSIPLRTIASDVPTGTMISSLSGSSGMESTSKGGPPKTKKQLVVGFETPMNEDGSMPGEIDEFLGELRGEASIRRHFPLMEVSGLRANAAKKNGMPTASYSLICRPPVEKAAPPASKGPAAAKGKR